MRKSTEMYSSDNCICESATVNRDCPRHKYFCEICRKVIRIGYRLHMFEEHGQEVS